MGEASYESRIAVLEQQVAKHDSTLEKLADKLEEVVRLLSTRPTWLVTAAITLLTTTSVSLIVYVVTTHGRG